MTSTTQPTATTTGFSPHPDQTSPMTVGPEEFYDDPARITDAMVKAFFAELKKRNAPLPFTEDAKAAIEAALSTVPAGDGVPGMVLVPKVPTWEMEVAGRDVLCDTLDPDAATYNARDCYRAMLSASTAGKG